MKKEQCENEWKILTRLSGDRGLQIRESIIVMERRQMELAALHIRTGNRRSRANRQFASRTYGEMRRNKIRTKNRSRTLIALLYWAKLIGINPFTLTRNYHLEISYHSVFWAFILIAGNSYIFYASLLERILYVMPGETPIAVFVDFGEISCLYLETLCTWLLNLISKDRIVLIIKAFKQAERTSKNLDLAENYEKHLKKLVIYLILSNTIIFSAVVFVNVAMINHSDYNLGLWMIFNLQRAIPIYSQTLFVWCLTVLNEKFRRLNKRLCSFMQNSAVKRGENTFPRRSINAAVIRDSSCDSPLLAERIKTISQSHRELRDLIRRIAEHFAFFIMIAVSTQLMAMTYDVYGIYRYVKTHGLTRTIDILFVTSFGILLIIPIMILAIISNVCGSVSYEANKTGNILHSSLNDSETFLDPREAAEFNVLSLDLLRNKTRISIFGLFYIDHFFIYEIIGKAATYLVIMLQFYA